MRLSGYIEGRHDPPSSRVIRVGVLPGEGVGPEVTETAISILTGLADQRELPLALARGPDTSISTRNGALTEAATDFCRDTFAAGGAVVMGAHGGRWVYELRGKFDLFCKLSPIRSPAVLSPAASTISPAALGDLDLLVVREQTGGAYQGRWAVSESARDGRIAEHSSSYSRRQVRRILGAAARMARVRTGRLAVVVKRGGIPAASALWRECAEEEATELELEIVDVDYAVYRLIREPATFDVILAPNLFGDVLSDAAAVLLGARGNSFGASFDAAGAAVYQTNHGAAYDLAGTDRANPIGQILSIAMMLRESFGLTQEAAAVEEAVASTWAAGWRTADLAEPGCNVVGTTEMAQRVLDALASRAARRSTPMAAGE